VDEQRFDDLTRRLASRRSRRSLLRGAIAAALASAAGARPVRRVIADSEPDSDRDHDRGRGCKRAGKNCKNDGQCCSGLICGDNGSCQPGCRIDGATVAPGLDPANPCRACAPDVATEGWTLTAPGATCREGDACTGPALCDGAGRCVEGEPVACEQATDRCRASQGTCDPVAGCVYDLLPPGTLCDESDPCNPGYCDESGACVTSPVCDPECQVCEHGTCTDIDEFVRKPCQNGRGYCAGGVCTLPCGEACTDYCQEVIDTGNSPTGTFFCCPEEARLPDGHCCWIGNQVGEVSADGFCGHPRQICDDGLLCMTECCGITDTDRGSCPGPFDVCIDGALTDAALPCTTDDECVAAGFAVCAQLKVERDDAADYRPIENSGFCCPHGAQSTAYAEGPITIYDCCSSGQKVVSDGGCCPYPAYDFDCPSCSCSFNRISRCCF